MKTYGELYREIDRDDIGFVHFKAGWDAAGGVDRSDYSQAQEAHLWAIYKGEN